MIRYNDDGTVDREWYRRHSTAEEVLEALDAANAALAVAEEAKNAAIRLWNDCGADLLAAEERERKLRELVKGCQNDLAEYIVPDSGITEHDVVNRLLARLDGSQARAALKDAP